MYLLSALSRHLLPGVPVVRLFVVGLALLVVLACDRSSAGNWGQAVRGVAADSGVYDVDTRYASAFNTNQVDSLLMMLTDDVVLLPPGEGPVVGKARVRAWAAGAFGSGSYQRELMEEEVIASGDWAIERYRWRSTRTTVGGGPVVTDSGWGMLVLQHDGRGQWRVARDAFSSVGAPPPRTAGVPRRPAAVGAR